MKLSEYQSQSRSTALYPPIQKKFVYPAMGLANEAGEFMGVVKKIFRDKEGQVDEETRRKVSKELGDVLWYLAQVATEFDLNLNDIAKENLEKLKSRKERGVIKGSGDER